jgi:hypothetical protein
MKRKEKKPKKKRPEYPPVWMEGEKLDEETGEMKKFRYKLRVRC